MRPCSVVSARFKIRSFRAIFTRLQPRKKPYPSPSGSKQVEVGHDITIESAIGGDAAGKDARSELDTQHRRSQLKMVFPPRPPPSHPTSPVCSPDLSCLLTSRTWAVQNQ
jgi:hypothetical protein